MQQVDREQQEYENRPINVRMTGTTNSVSRYSFRTDRVDLQPNNAGVTYPDSILRVGPYHSFTLIRTWRKVVTLLCAVVLSFALCNLPFHFRKMLLYYYDGYQTMSDFALLATPITNLFQYLNSALNPVLYSFMSHNFRSCVRDVLACRYTWKGKRRQPNSHLSQNGNPLQLHAIKEKKLIGRPLSSSSGNKKS